MNHVAMLVGYAVEALCAGTVLVRLWYELLNTVYVRMKSSSDFSKIAFLYFREKRRHESGGLLTVEDLQERDAL